MSESRPEKLLLRHYQNLLQLAERQLDAIERRDMIMAQDCANQKQMIIEQMGPDGAAAGNQCAPAMRHELQELINRIMEFESRSQQIVQERQNKVKEGLLAARQNAFIQKKYAHSPANGNFINVVK